jgi:hypothetical protein
MHRLRIQLTALVRRYVAEREEPNHTPPSDWTKYENVLWFGASTITCGTESVSITVLAGTRSLLCAAARSVTVT